MYFCPITIIVLIDGNWGIQKCLATRFFYVWVKKYLKMNFKILIGTLSLICHLVLPSITLLRNSPNVKDPVFSFFKSDTNLEIWCEVKMNNGWTNFLNWRSRFWGTWAIFKASWDAWLWVLRRNQLERAISFSTCLLLYLLAASLFPLVLRISKIVPCENGEILGSKFCLYLEILFSLSANAQSLKIGVSKSMNLSGIFDLS